MIGKKFGFFKDKRRKKHLLEWVLFLAFAAGVYVFARAFDVLERIVVFSWRHESWEIDELLVVCVAIAAGLLIQQIRRANKLKKALAEIHRLRGILPICACCKKIRDDEGYWHQVEAYISRYSEALFSHGICPECLDNFYPEFAEDLNRRVPSGKPLKQ